jgi:hypothetical protein
MAGNQCNYGATNVAPNSESPTPPLIEELDPLLNTYMSRREQISRVINLDEACSQE